jgi:hypothetical protein
MRYIICTKIVHKMPCTIYVQITQKLVRSSCMQLGEKINPGYYVNLVNLILIFAFFKIF